ncbi:MAG: alpha/beta fold hydrolase [Saprospiraceae bacterium]
MLDSLSQPDWAAIGPLVGSCKAAPLTYSLLEDMAGDVIGLMDALNIVQANIVGASMGGAIAQLVAIHFPARILTMTCLSSTSGNPARAPGDAQALSAMSVPPPDSIDPDTLADYLINIYRTLGAVDSDDILGKELWNMCATVTGTLPVSIGN